MLITNEMQNSLESIISPPKKFCLLYMFRLKHVEQTKNFRIKLIVKELCISLVINILQYDARYT
jgi:hypothetical protein